jgi:hypothetical protein
VNDVGMNGFPGRRNPMSLACVPDVKLRIGTFLVDQSVIFLMLLQIKNVKLHRKSLLSILRRIRRRD